jgi:hypothetical protein
MRERRNAYRISVGKPGEKRPFGKPRYRWENIRMGLEEIVWEAVDLINRAEYRTSGALVNTVINLRIP